MASLFAPLKRGPWRHARRRDLLHVAVVVGAAMVLSLGLVWLAYLVYVWRVAARSPLAPPDRRDVLVFGRKLVGGRPERDYQQRLARALGLVHEERVARLFLLGGCSGGRVSEAEAGLAWLREHGLPLGLAPKLEQASTDSLDNLRHARSLLRHDAGDDNPGTAVPPVALVTSRYHLPRCLLLAHWLGFEASVPVAAEERLRLDRRIVLRLLAEAAYVMWIDLGLRWARRIGAARLLMRVR
ncbi:ElyC/SanA/YdcF family protein [Dyella sp. 2RAB6]|uniref:ElyC/SanA/YdcF family protein n=1 Tax=Dyella sp. 2RAB6 TaxID=3232992 RepID=UPI003F920DFA